MAMDRQNAAASDQYVMLQGKISEKAPLFRNQAGHWDTPNFNNFRQANNIGSRDLVEFFYLGKGIIGVFLLPKY